jgi:hypothetical protein
VGRVNGGPRGAAGGSATRSRSGLSGKRVLPVAHVKYTSLGLARKIGAPGRAGRLASISNGAGLEADGRLLKADRPGRIQ